MNHQTPHFMNYLIAGIAGTFLLILLIGVPMYAVPKWNVYRAEQSGTGQYRKAEQNRKIALLEAQAEFDSAELKKQTDILRAEGIAEANRIIGASITPQYIQWRWVEGLHDGTGERIYIPTEANLPILEAGRP